MKVARQFTAWDACKKATVPAGRYDSLANDILRSAAVRPSGADPLAARCHRFFNRTASAQPYESNLVCPATGAKPDCFGAAGGLVKKILTSWPLPNRVFKAATEV